MLSLAAITKLESVSKASPYISSSSFCQINYKCRVSYASDELPDGWTCLPTQVWELWVCFLLSRAALTDGVTLKSSLCHTLTDHLTRHLRRVLKLEIKNAALWGFKNTVNTLLQQHVDLFIRMFVYLFGFLFIKLGNT